MRTATRGPVEHILDWSHLSMRVRHAEQVMCDLCAVKPPLIGPPDHAQADVESLQHLLWNGYHEKAGEALGRIMSWTETATMRNERKRCGVAVLPGWVLGVVGLLEAGSFELTLCLTLTTTRGLDIAG